MAIIPQQQWFVPPMEFLCPPPPPKTKSKPRPRNKKDSKSSPSYREVAKLRERKRMRVLNEVFDRLRAILPCTKPPGKKLSKSDTLKNSIEYINFLSSLLSSGQQGEYQPKAPAPNYYNWLRHTKEKIQQPQYEYHEQNGNCIIMENVEWLLEEQQRFVM
ncbi:hypothetical protein NPIL_781 [Nephila pilipes]|uniref:BHLH domain-containing protein n=1 Tax=Nephila pilipes TaxID=299642 RepID=A0A8X6I4Q0_NEPPI|nr:hypothetical protein NPIL_781 [Nephila pilipes]